MVRSFLGMNRLKTCYVCNSSAPAELPGQERCCFTQCWGPELYNAVVQAAQSAESELTDDQRKLLVDSAEGTYVREQWRSCPHALEGKRFFHQTCLQTSQGARHQSLSHDNKLFAAPSRKTGGSEGSGAVGGPKPLRDLRHHLCQECLLQVTQSTDVKAPPVRTLRDEEKHRQRRSDKAASISIKRHKAKLEALEAKGVISVTFHQSRAKRWQTSTSECVKQMALDHPEFAQQFEAAAAHLMKLISDADWRQEQMKRHGPQALVTPVPSQAPPPPSAPTGTITVPIVPACTIAAAPEVQLDQQAPLPPVPTPEATSPAPSSLAITPEPQPDGSAESQLPGLSAQLANPSMAAGQHIATTAAAALSPAASARGKGCKRAPDNSMLKDQDAMAACVTLYNVQQNKRKPSAGS